MYLNGDYRHISNSNATYNLFITTCNYDSGNLVHDLNKCNGDFRLNVWRKDWCKVHNCLNSNPPCSCEPPFQLFKFPTVKKHPELRLLWCKLVNRAPFDQSNSSQPKLWTPGSKSRICSSHFVDGEPTAENPHPTLNLGY